MKIEIIERLSVSPFIEDNQQALNIPSNISVSNTSKNRISHWSLVDMNLRGKSGLANDENSMMNAYLSSVPNLLIVGTESGRIFYYALPTAHHGSSINDEEPSKMKQSVESSVGSVPNFRSIRPVEVSIPSVACHNAQISALMVLWQANNTPAATSTAFGSRQPQDTLLIFSGSLDRTIKIWNFSDISNANSGGAAVGGGGSSGGPANILAQTLYGHSGAISQIVDGSRDGQGSILSSSMDGTIRVWIAQKGRNFIQNPYYECAFVYKASERVWLTGLVVSYVGPWVCYAADSQGNIEVLRKGADVGADKAKHSNSLHAISKIERWEKFHRLGITQISIMRDENLLLTLSTDSTCKITDPATGHVLFTIANNNKCQFTGITWIKELSCFYLVDEMGTVDIFSHFHEKIVDSASLIPMKSATRQNILKSHTGQLALGLTQFHQRGYFLTLTESTADATSKSWTSVEIKAAAAAVGVVGDLCLWCINRDANCVDFLGHQAAVLAISVPTFIHRSTGEVQKNLRNPPASPEKESSSTGYTVSQRLRALKNEKSRTGKNLAQTLQVSEAENLFFSISQDDGTIRCWDEYDQQENYQFRLKGTSEVTVMLCLWEINRIVTGHDNGMVCLWNADTGNKVESKELRGTVSSLVEAKNLHSRILIGGDYNGKIAIWNLTLHMLNPTNLATETMFQGFHDRDDPGILSVAFHYLTNTVFSGGNDRTIRYWKLHHNSATSIWDPRMESICFLKCTPSYIFAGDDSGNLNLYRITSHMPHHASGQSSHTLFISDVTPLCSWSCLYPTRSIADIVELSTSRAFIVQVGGTGNGRTKIWEIDFTAIAHHKSAKHSKHDLDLKSDSSSVHTKGDESLDSAHPSLHSHGTVHAKSVPSALNSFCEVHDLNFFGSHHISVKEIFSVNPEKFEISCCSLTCHSARSIKGYLTESIRFSLYLGSNHGNILKFTFTK